MLTSQIAIRLRNVVNALLEFKDRIKSIDCIVTEPFYSQILSVISTTKKM